MDYSLISTKYLNVLVFLLACTLLLFWLVQWIMHVTSIFYGWVVFVKNHKIIEKKLEKEKNLNGFNITFNTRKNDLYSRNQSNCHYKSIQNTQTIWEPKVSDAFYYQRSPQHLRGVTILKPLMGLDSRLKDNLLSFFNLDYPQFEILFCVENEFDPCVNLVKRLIKKFPQVDAQLLTDAKREWVNPKINNMIQGYKRSKYPFLLISDSSIKTKPHTLSIMMKMMDEKTGLVHQMPFMSDGEGMTRIVEKIYFGTQHAKIYLVSDLLGINCITGMSCLYRKSILEEAGGLATVGIYLAEDYHLSRIFIERGFKSRLSSLPALQNVTPSNLRTFKNRMLRWTILRKHLVPTTILMEPLSECFILGTLASICSRYIFNINFLYFLLIHCFAWITLDYRLFKTIQGPRQTFSRTNFFLGWMTRELNSPTVIFRAFFRNKVRWRTRTFIVGSEAKGMEIRGNINII